MTINMFNWIRLPRSIRCKFRGCEADIWPTIDLSGEKVFQYAIMDKGMYTAKGSESTEKAACKKCEELLQDQGDSHDR